jgi:UDP:flavonoid glycosyltransferase YjiC (YdhE family)
MRVLIVAEAVTLAHSARCAALALGLAERGHEVLVAGAVPASQGHHPRVRWLPLPNIGPARFVRALRSGQSPYSARVLQDYLSADRALIAEQSPEAVIADFRPTAVTAAQAAGVRALALVNAYWTPRYAAEVLHGRYPLPVLPLSGLVPLRLAERLFHTFAPSAMQRQARPWHAQRQALGLPLEGCSLAHAYAAADACLHPDLPSMFQPPPPAHRAPVHPVGHFLGALMWSPLVPNPAWWSQLDGKRPAVYINLGSSGAAAALPRILQAVEQETWQCFAAASGVGLPGSRALIAPLIHGQRACERADLVINNGGSMGCQQAFAAGKPILGIASNMDQFLNMQAVERAGAGLCLRADRLKPETVRHACCRLLAESSFAEASARLGREQASLDPIALCEQALRPRPVSVRNN